MLVWPPPRRLTAAACVCTVIAQPLMAAFHMVSNATRNDEPLLGSGIVDGSVAQV